MLTMGTTAKMTMKQERDAYQWAASKHCILFERLYYILKDIVITNNIELTKDQIKMINAYNTWNIRAWEHRDEMSFKDYPNKQFFDSIIDCAEDDVLIY